MASPAGRLVSLDAFRGLTIAAMILVNNPGSWSAIYWPLGHAAWHGWTPTDLIFPFFLFIVGVAIHFSRKGSPREALRRAAVLVGLGLFMAGFPFFDLGGLRIPGVLQRIGVCYLAAWLLRRRFGPRGLVGWTAGLLLGYWGLMTLVPVPGGLPPNLERETNLAAWLDRLLLEGHMWRQTRTWDPEGILSTLPAIATTLSGVLAGHWLRSGRDAGRTALGLVAVGAALALAGLAWGAWFPINKNLWTSSYVLLSSGCASALFGAVYWIADVRGARGWTRPFVVYGTNAIFVFVASGLLAKLLGIVKLGGSSLHALVHQALFASWLAPKDASLGYALLNVAFWYGVLHLMDRRGLHIKV